MNCERCSAPMPASMKFCVSCGQPRVTASAPSSFPTPSSFSPPSSFPTLPVQTPSVQTPSVQTPPVPPQPQTPQVQTQPIPPQQPAYATVPPSPSIPPMPAATTGVQLPSSQIRLAPGEVVMKTFPISGITKGLGSLRGELTLTDVRVIYSAHAKNTFGESRTCLELQIADVNGAALMTRRGLTPLSFLTIVISLILGLVFVGFLKNFVSVLTYRAGAGFADFVTFLLYFLFIAIAVVLIYIRAKSTEVVFALFARSVDVSPIRLSGAVGRQDEGFLAITVAAFGRPVLAVMEHLGILDADDAGDAADLAETQRMYDEIGALILDIQNRGVLGGTD